MKVPFAFPEIGDDEINEVVEVLKSGWLTTASRCDQFEKDFACFVGAKYALAVNSATAALHLGLEALGIGEGDKVFVPTFTFTATAEVVRYLGGCPVFVDCDPDTCCITVEQIEKACRLQHVSADDPHVKALIPVHFGGHPCDMNPLLAFAEKNGLKVLEDAAHALPTRYQGKLVGAFGDATCFSFYANKTITTGEGGMLCTDNEAVSRRVKAMRLHGINRDVWNRFSTGASWEYDVIAPGFKYNMPDVLAAIGIHQIKKAENFREKRRQIAQAYCNALKGVDGLSLPQIRCQWTDHSWYLFSVLLDPAASARQTDRNSFIQKMAEKNIGASVHYKPVHRMTYYRDRYGLQPQMFPNAERIFQSCVSLPIFSAMTRNQLEYVIDSIKEILT